MAQIVGYLTATEARHFHDYARACDLGASTVANLLISRELRLKRLAIRPQLSDHTPSALNDAKIVAHLTDDAKKTLFREHAEACAMKPSAAAAALFRAELNDHWLLQALRR